MRKLALFTICLGVFLLIAYDIKKSVSNKNQPKPNPNLQIPSTPIQPIAPEPPPKMTVDQAISEINQEQLKKHMDFLCSNDLEGRMSGKSGNVKAAEYIKKTFESYGLNTTYQKFNIQRINPGPNNEIGDNFTQNIVAWMEGADPQVKNEIVVIGAHMDHIGYGPQMSRFGGGRIHPGADDNASGTSALLEIAKAFSLLKGQNNRTVIFIAFSAEEMGLIGSRYYCNNPIFPQGSPNIKNHIFMLNMDMVGYLGNAKQNVAFNSGESSVDVAKIISELSGKYSFAKGITSRGSGGSDHASFYNKGIPIAFLHTGLHSHYHTPSDTVDKINFDGIEKVAKYGFELAWAVTNTNNKPSFDYGSFHPMEYTHDHGHSEFPFLERN